MPAEEENEERKLKSFWWLPFAFLLLFLAGGGYYALITMRQAAHKLAVGDNYTQLSANSAVYSGAAALRKSDNFFASDEPAAVEAASPDKLKPFSVARGIPAPAGDAAGSASSAAQAWGDNQAAAAGAAASGAPGSFSARLAARASGFPAGQGTQSSRTSADREVEAFQGGGPAAGKPSVQRETTAASARRGAGGGVLGALKGAFRASLYGARIASNDAAKGWIARSFDASPDSENAIQYDEKVRAGLDRINPNSIPRFLREQDISAAEAKTLAVSDVGKPETDVEGTKEALENDNDYQRKKAAAELARSVINPMFAGMSGGMSGATRGEPAPAGGAADPSGPPSLMGVDGYGNTATQGNGGLNYIFGPDGKILGCEDPQAGMCLMPGAGSCPAGLILP